jgi:hypothetical protein
MEELSPIVAQFVEYISRIYSSHQEKPKPRVARVGYRFYTGLHLACLPKPKHTFLQVLIQN